MAQLLSVNIVTRDSWAILATRAIQHMHVAHRLAIYIYGTVTVRENSDT